jgi:predicted nuclease of predicted toxin-antitoxin system
VRFLIDESMSARVAELLVVAGHDAVHVGDLGLLGAPDTHVMVAARQSGRSVVSADTDFGELLAIGRHPGPSVVLLRRAPHRPDDQTKLLLAALDQVEADLDAGAMVVLGADGSACVDYRSNRCPDRRRASLRSDAALVCTRIRDLDRAARPRAPRRQPSSGEQEISKSGENFGARVGLRRA